MKILITGGLGYIGSHVATVLIQNDIDTVLIDTLENSRIQVLEGIESITGKTPVFRKIDVGEEIEMNQLFEEFPDIGGVIHFWSLGLPNFDPWVPPKHPQSTPKALHCTLAASVSKPNFFKVFAFFGKVVQNYHFSLKIMISGGWGGGPT